MNLVFQAAGKTDIGLVRKNNEDNFGFDLRRGIFVVCDGMGGAAAGEVASKIAVDTVLAYFTMIPAIPNRRCWDESLRAYRTRLPDWRTPSNWRTRLFWKRRHIIQIVPAWVQPSSQCVWTENFSPSRRRRQPYLSGARGKYSATDERPFAGDGASASWAADRGRSGEIRNAERNRARSGFGRQRRTRFWKTTNLRREMC